MHWSTRCALARCARRTYPRGRGPCCRCTERHASSLQARRPGARCTKAGYPSTTPAASGCGNGWASPETFYDATRIAILPMGFCFPGTGRSGDLPPRSECAPLWRQRLLDQMQQIELTLLIGDYAQRWHLPDAESKNVTDTVAAWRIQWPAVLPMPHPSPRNNIWLKINPWFLADVVPALQGRVAALLSR